MDDIFKPSNYSAQFQSIISVFQGTSTRGQSGVEPAHQSIEERALQRVRNEDILHQQNIEDVVQGAAERLAHEEPGTNTHPVDEDWLRQFKINVQDISEKEMKLIWSKVLAGEMKKPKSYSRRTLHLLSKLSKEDAEIITKIAPYTLSDDSGKWFILHENIDKGRFFRFEDLLFLNELGLVETSSSLNINWSFDDESEDHVICIKSANGLVGINIHTSQKEFNMPVYTLTVIGREIFSLIEDVKPNLEYYKYFFELLVRDGKCICGHIKEDCCESEFVFLDEIFKIDKTKEHQNNPKL